MRDFVVDASALVEVFVGASADHELRSRILTGSNGAPEMLDIEAASTLRSLVRRGDLPGPDADVALGHVIDAPISRVSHRALLARVWELRNSITAYDAVYIALAEQLDVPLLTCDARLGRAHGHDAEVVVYPRS